jgi:hypothetical protein
LAEHPTLMQMATRLLHPGQRSLSSRTVEAFGWLLLLEGSVVVLVPQGVAALLSLPGFSVSAAVYFRLVGLLISGLGLLYVVSGRLNAQGSVFASLIDRPMVPPVMFVLWSLGLCPGILATLFSLQDFLGFLWTLWAWKKDEAAASAQLSRPS